WVEAEQRQLEAVLAAGLAVTAAGVAAVTGQQGHDVVGKVQRPGFVGIADGDAHRPGLSGDLDGDRRLALAGRPHVPSTADAADGGGAEGEAGLAGEVGRPSRVLGGDEELPSLIQAGQIDLLGKDGKRGGVLGSDGPGGQERKGEGYQESEEGGNMKSVTHR